MRRLELATRLLPDGFVNEKIVFSAVAVHDTNANYQGPGWDAGVSGPVDIGSG